MLGVNTLFIVGALLALTPYGDDCTQGSADGMSAAGLALPFYLLGALLLIVRRPAVPKLRLLVFPAVPTIYHTWFALHFAYGYWLDGMSACQAITGDDFGYDGREPFFSIIWLTLSAAFWLSVAVAIKRAPAQGFAS